MMMMRRKLGSVCAKFGGGRRTYSSGTSCDRESDFSYFVGMARRTFARGVAFGAGYFICGAILSPVDPDLFKESIEKLESAILDVDEKLKELRETT